MLFSRSVPSLAAAIVVPLCFACTAIFAPRDDVQRCGSADDCDATGDPRYVTDCKYDDANAGLDSTQVEKICVAALAVPGCQPPMNASTPYGAAFEQYESASHWAPDTGGCTDNPGSLGCKPDPNTATCADGLSRNSETTLCDDGSGVVFSPIGESTSETSIAGQDVRDQYCRSFFCNENFVCDTSDYRCRECDPSKPFGEGGCGEIYISGAPSCVYQTADQLKDSCKGSGSNIDEPTFGTCT